MHLRYSYYSGAGNSFFLFDNRDQTLPDLSLYAKAICETRSDSDGIIVVEPSFKGDYLMKVYNRDGTTASQCGNGLRVFVKFLQELNVIKDEYFIETLSSLNLCKGKLFEERVQITFPFFDPSLKVIPHSSFFNYPIYFLNTGVPHVVIPVEHLDQVDIHSLGKKIRYSSLFGTAGTNVNFITIQDHLITVRTYERGVERETLACGTGCLAASIVAHQIFNIPAPYTLKVRSNERLKVHFMPSGEIMMEGSAIYLCKGTIVIKEDNQIEFSKNALFV